MSDTPETDAEEEASHNFAELVVPSSLARRLERERNETRRSLEHITEYGTEEINVAVDLRQRLATALVERDEARKALKIKQ